MLIIPKMKMPVNCEYCPCNSESHCSAIWFISEGKEDTCIPDKYLHISGEGGRWNKCPLIEKEPGIRILREK